MKFRITVRKTGAPDSIRTVEAASRFEIYEQVRTEGGTVIALTELHGFALGQLAHFNISIGTGIKHMEIMRTAKNLAAMLSAGLSISRALSIIERQTSNIYLKKVAANLSDSIRKGSSLHEALALYPRVFPEIFIAMVRSGEESGSLSESLHAIALQMERSEELIRKIKGAMIYPAIVIGAVIIVAILMLIYVVPTLTNTFTALGVQVPLATRAIVALSNFMAGNISLIAALFIFTVTGSILFVRSAPGASAVLTVALHLPIIGELVRETYSARMARTLSSLLASGVPMLEALSITKEVVHARAFAAIIEEAHIRVKKGENLSSSFSEHADLYPILMSDMLAVGEETGKVADMLKQVAEFYEVDVAEKTKDLSTIIEPALMILIGVVVGFFAVSMIAPIYQLSSAI